MVKDNEEFNGEIEDCLIKKEHELWGKCNSFLYDHIITHQLEWPSLTVQWMPDQEVAADKDYCLQKIILGTYTSGNEPNYLMIGQVQLPTDDIGSESGKVRIVQRINHEGEVIRARYMPQNPSMIATKTVSGEVHVFDYSKHPSEPSLEGVCNPDLRLRGHSCEGFGLSWSTINQGRLLSGSDDAQICLWDINSTSKNKFTDALQVFKVNEGVIEDVAWHSRNEYLFGSVGDIKKLLIWDVRTYNTNSPVQSVDAHQSAVICLAFNPFNEWLLATGSADTTVNLFDLRKIDTPLHTFLAHKEEIFQVGWSPKDERILASSCAGRRLLVWDISSIHDEKILEDEEEDPPGLLFVHYGHTSQILDFSFNPCKDWVIASIADDDNIIQIWKMAKIISSDVDYMVIGSD